ncbi:MAG TPA: site-specific integrase [Dehalococcoidia bacterium]|nr:site-specific integrase [Dehalococcoidia bacterium]
MSARHPLSPKQIKELLDTLAPGNGSAYQRRCSIRNKAIALLMLDAGCRACELCYLTYLDAYWQGQVRETLDIRCEVAKYGVGGQIPISPRLHAALEDLRLAYHPNVAALDNRYLIYVHKASLPVSRRQVHRIIAEAGREALGQAVYPHMLRHTYADTMSAVCDAVTLKYLMRHKHLSSTDKYTHRNGQRMADAVAAGIAKQMELAS